MQNDIQDRDYKMGFTFTEIIKLYKPEKIAQQRIIQDNQYVAIDQEADQYILCLSASVFNRFLNYKRICSYDSNKDQLVYRKVGYIIEMKEDDYMYFAEELHEITPRIIPSKYGKIFSLTAGMPGQPLILVVHGSGPKNSADSYAFLLHEYLVSISYIQKFYIVAIDCPGYGRSVGSKQAVKTFPLELFQQILKSLNYKNYYAMLGHSQGGAAIFNAVFQDPRITQFMIMDRPVCGNIQRFRGFSVPTLLIYDIEDDGHPVWQGKLLYKELKHAQFYTYRESKNNYWAQDFIWEKMLNFFGKGFKQSRKSHFDITNEKRNKSQSKKQSTKKKSLEASKVIYSVDKIQKIKKSTQKQQKLMKIEEIQKSELLSFSSEYNVEELQQNYFQVETKNPKFNKQQAEIHFQEQQMQIIKQKREENHKKMQKMQKKVSEKQINENLTKEQLLKGEHKCAICYEILYRPITTNCNHQFCHKCIIESLLVNQKCPLCRAIITKKVENKALSEQLIHQISQKDIERRENEFKKIQNMLKSIVYLEIGNHSRQLQTKQSHFSKTKKKYIWEVFVKQPKNFGFQEVWFNINMGETTSKPVKLKNSPFVFESRGTFSFACQITIKPKNKQYGDLIDVYRINVEPGTHIKKIALRKKCYIK